MGGIQLKTKPRRTPKEQIAHERLKELLHYNPLTGLFTWRVRRSSNIYPGDAAGGVANTGYIQVYVENKNYVAHRLAWFWMTGEWPKYVDHINRDRKDNRWGNLRACDQSQNGANSVKPKNNTSGYKGVSFDKRKGLWFAQIMVSREHYFLGYFTDPADAHAAYCAAAKKHWGDFARNN